MPRKTVWTEGQDTQIRRLRTEGAGWDVIALALSLARWTVIERARAIGAEKPPPNAVTVLDEADREPLPAGHTETWGAINRGTALEDVPFQTPEQIPLSAAEHVHQRWKDQTMKTPRATTPAATSKSIVRPLMTNGYEIDADYVVYRLEEAGATLLALPGTGYSTRLRSSSLEIVRTALEAYGWTEARIRPSVPAAEKISRMDEAMSWIPLIPLDRYVLRRVVGARSLVHPITDRHLFPWRRLGKALGADHKAIQRWHTQGIGLIVTALRAVP